MRLFLAIDLPTDIKDSLYAGLKPLRDDYGAFKWIPKENYHLTTMFFGETTTVEKIEKKLDQCLFDQESFHLYSYKVEMFLRSSIAIYLSFNKEKRLFDLDEKLKIAFPDNIYLRDEFIPHITLARYKIPSKQQYLHLKKKLTKIDIDVEFKVKSLTLFESIPTKYEHLYRKIKSFKFI